MGSQTARALAFTAADVAAILCERGWLDSEATLTTAAAPGEPGPPAMAEDCASREAGYPGQATQAWLADAAALLGPHAADRASLAELLSLVFQHDARAILQLTESHVILSREGAREVIRELAHLVLEGSEVDSGRFKDIVNALKERLPFRGRELFHPIRLALAGRAGEGEFDRVILLLDRAARLPFRVPVKSARRRILEFCAAVE
jgi:hypothetical protein